MYSTVDIMTNPVNGILLVYCRGRASIIGVMQLANDMWTRPLYCMRPVSIEKGRRAAIFEFRVTVTQQIFPCFQIVVGVKFI